MFAKLAWTETKLSIREPTVIIFALAFPLILLYLLLNSFGTQPDPDFSGVNTADYYVPAYIAGTIAALGLIAIPVHLAAYRERGVLRRLRASGISPGSVLIAQTIVSALIIGVAAIIMVVLGNASYELSTPASWATLAGGTVLTTVTFCAIGVALSSLLGTARAAQAIGLLLFFGMFFVSGGGPPKEILPDGAALVADAFPFSHAVDVMQQAWWNGGWHGTGVAVQIGVLIASVGIAIKRLRYV
jgi:ABC-2 type transport system permease protein